MKNKLDMYRSISKPINNAANILNLSLTELLSMMSVHHTYVRTILIIGCMLYQIVCSVCPSASFTFVNHSPYPSRPINPKVAFFPVSTAGWSYASILSMRPA